MSATPGITKTSAAGSVRRTIKLGISACYLVLRSGWDGLCLLGGGERKGTGVVLYYHSVPPLYRAQFEEQMRVVAKRSRPIALTELNSLPARCHSVAITFDDALKSVLDNAIPVLLELGIPAAIFAVTDVLGTKPEWGKWYYSPDERMMTEEQLRSLPELICVGSHSLTHPDLVLVSAEDAAREIAHSREKLQSLLQRPVTLFGFPFGSFNAATLRYCRDAGYERAFTTEPTMIPGDTSEFVIGRVGVDPWDWRWEFRLKMLGAYSWLPYATTVKLKLKQLMSQKRRDSKTLESGEPSEKADGLSAHPNLHR